MCSETIVGLPSVASCARRLLLQAALRKNHGFSSSFIHSGDFCFHSAPLMCLLILFVYLFVSFIDGQFFREEKFIVTENRSRRGKRSPGSAAGPMLGKIIVPL